MKGEIWGFPCFLMYNNEKNRKLIESYLMPEIIIVDTSVLIALEKTELLQSLLCKIYKEIILVGKKCEGFLV